MNNKSMAVAAATCVALLVAAPVQGQVVRETDINSIAGLLDAFNTADTFGFSSRGNEILFADVDSEIYQVQGRRGSDHDDEGGCGTHTTMVSQHVENGGCGDDDGGVGGLCLQVFDPAGIMICWADRPARPGWQRDPALVCPLPFTQSNSSYQLRIIRKEGSCGPGGHGHQSAFMAVSSEDPGISYIINWSLRRVATDGDLKSQSNR